MTKVLIADNHEVICEGMRAIIDLSPSLTVVGMAHDGQQAVTQAEDLAPDIIIMDVRMPRMDGVAACKAIKKAVPDTRVLMMSVYDDDRDVFAAIEAGASGYLIKDFTPKDLFTALDTIQRGQSYFHPIIAKKLADRFRHLSNRQRDKLSLFANLTRREMEVLELLGGGLSNKDIAKELFVSECTVKSHISNILRKLDKHDRTQLALYALEKGIV